MTIAERAKACRPFDGKMLKGFIQVPGGLIVSVHRINGRREFSLAGSVPMQGWTDDPGEVRRFERRTR